MHPTPVARNCVLTTLHNSQKDSYSVARSSSKQRPWHSKVVVRVVQILLFALLTSPFKAGFAKLRKATIGFVMSVSASVRLPVRPSVGPHGTTWIPLDRFSLNVWIFFENISVKIWEEQRVLYMETKVAGSSVGIAIGYGLEGPGSDSGRDEIFRTCPDRSWGPPSLLYNGYRVFPGGKERPGRDVHPSLPSSAVVKKE